MVLKIIEHGSTKYDQMVQLRMEILRKPLGLTFLDADLQKEKNDLLTGAFINNSIVGCCILTPKTNNTIQLRQMAVSNDVQGQGIGSAIVAFAEKTALAHQFTTLMMHARKEAVPFYLKCGYTITSEEFIEVTIPHVEMQKKLQ
jgi:predicted GNAT family N-acyltransferase